MERNPFEPQFNLFVYGTKSGLLVNRNEFGYFELEHRFPFIQFIYSLKIEDEDLVVHARLYVKTEQQRLDFIKRGFSKGTILPFKHDVMGEFLGFPPIAIRDFAKGIDSKERISIDYYGHIFVTKKQHVRKCLKWLKINMPVSIEFINKYNSKVEFDELTETRGGFQPMETVPNEWKEVV